MYDGNGIHEADRWEIAGHNASEGIEPRNNPSSGEADSVHLLESSKLLGAVWLYTVVRPGVLDHGMLLQGFIRNLGEPVCSL